MKCPSCAEVALTMSERQGVEIDYCPQCRGAWLDRGELDKLIERAAVPAPNPNNGSGAQTGYRDDGYIEGGYREGGYREGGYREGGYRDERQNHRKKSWLSDIFD